MWPVFTYFFLSRFLLSDAKTVACSHMIRHTKETHFSTRATHYTVFPIRLLSRVITVEV